jgi:hypothetical protein
MGEVVDQPASNRLQRSQCGGGIGACEELYSGDPAVPCSSGGD